MEMSKEDQELQLFLDTMQGKLYGTINTAVLEMCRDYKANTETVFVCGAICRAFEQTAGDDLAAIKGLIRRLARELGTGEFEVHEEFMYEMKLADEGKLRQWHDNLALWLYQLKVPEGGISDMIDLAQKWRNNGYDADFIDQADDVVEWLLGADDGTDRSDMLDTATRLLEDWYRAFVKGEYTTTPMILRDMLVRVAQNVGHDEDWCNNK